MRTEKILKYTLCRVVDPSKKVPDRNCEVQDLLLEVVDLKQEVPDLRSGGIRPNLTPGLAITDLAPDGRGRHFTKWPLTGDIFVQNCWWRRVKFIRQLPRYYTSTLTCIL